MDQFNVTYVAETSTGRFAVIFGTITTSQKSRFSHQ